MKTLLHNMFLTLTCLIGFFLSPHFSTAQITINNNLQSSYSTQIFSCDVNLTFNPVVTTSCGSGLLSTQLEIDFNGDGTVEINGNNSWTGDFPLGNHKLKVIASDNCGGMLTEEFDLAVIDGVAPVAVCDVDVLISLNGPDDIYYLKGTDIDEGSYDACSAVTFKVADFSTPNNLQDSIAIDTSHVGTNSVYVLTVYDAEGNSNQCWTNVIVSGGCINDTEPPIVSCHNYLNLSLDLNGMATLWAQTLDESSYDLCSYPLSYTFTILDTNGSPNRPDAVNQAFTTADIGVNPYRLYVRDAVGLVDSCDGVIDIATPPSLKTIKGVVFADANQDCTQDAGDTLLEGWRTRVESYPSGNSGWGSSLADGTYSMGVIPSISDTLIKVFLISPLNQGQSCQNVFYLDPDTLSNNPCIIDFPVTLNQNCASLTVDIAAPFLRRCFDSYYVVNYCNYGTETATGAYVEVTLDSFLIFTNSSIPFTTVNGQTYTFDLGDVASTDCGSFLIDVDVSCDAILGQTHCTEAHIFPDEFCHAPSANWSGASIDVNGHCQNDSIYFEIKNIGTENMPAPLNYIIIEDIIIHKSTPFQLDAGESINIVTAGKGQTCRIEADQEPFHPGQSHPSYTVERCGELPGGGVSLGFFTQLPQNEANDFISIDCQENIGSYDPNDKTASPKGVENAHFIEANTFLKYKIRFQNTGTDTAFKVVIEDPLPEELDPSTLRPGASSHPYVFELDADGTARFIFDNILLPDSNVNVAASQGFVNFTIDQMPDNPEGTHIWNTAAITFDFNEPIITNIAYHQIREELLTVASHEVFVPDVQLKVMPNPFHTSTTIQMEGLPDEQYTIKLFAVDGQLLRTATFSGNTYVVERNDLPKGLYFFHVESDNTTIATGKLICN